MRPMKMVLVVGAAAVALTTTACAELDEAMDAATSTTTSVATTIPTTTTTVYVPPPPPPTTINDRQIQALALDMTWDNLSAYDRQQVCDGVDLLGVKVAASALNKGADYEFDQADIEVFLLSKC
jgi:hypothetical protein